MLSLTVEGGGVGYPDHGGAGYPAEGGGGYPDLARHPLSYSAAPPTSGNKYNYLNIKSDKSYMLYRISYKKKDIDWP